MHMHNIDMNLNVDWKEPYILYLHSDLYLLCGCAYRMRMCVLTVHVPYILCLHSDSYLSWRDSFVWVIGLIHICDMAHSYMWSDSFIHVTRLIHTCDTPHSYLSWRDSFVWVIGLIHICDMAHSHVWSDSFTCVTWLLSPVIYETDMSHLYMTTFIYDIYI